MAKGNLQPPSPGLDNEWKELYTWFTKRRKEIKKRYESILNAGFLHKTDTRLAPELTKELYK